MVPGLGTVRALAGTVSAPVDHVRVKLSRLPASIRAVLVHSGSFQHKARKGAFPLQYGPNPTYGTKRTL